MTESTDQNTAIGWIELLCGCMFSGKSERLVARIVEARSRSESAIAFKHACDDRYAKRQIVTHGGQRLDAVPVASASRISDLAGDAKIIGIDEAQFFSADLVEVCRMLAQRGCQVIVAGLDLDSWGQPFGPIPAIEAIADQVTRTYAVCVACGGRADRTQRLAAVAGQKMIGGPEAYEPRCVACFEAPPSKLRR